MHGEFQPNVQERLNICYRPLTNNSNAGQTHHQNGIQNFAMARALCINLRWRAKWVISLTKAKFGLQNLAGMLNSINRFNKGAQPYIHFDSANQREHWVTTWFTNRACSGLDEFRISEVEPRSWGSGSTNPTSYQVTRLLLCFHQCWIKRCWFGEDTVWLIKPKNLIQITRMHTVICGKSHLSVANA